MSMALTQLGDHELLRRSSSDAEAFAVFYRRYERLVAGWLMHQTRNAQLAGDLTAEVFAAAYLAAPRFREGPAPAGAWLLGIARRKLLRSLRRQRAEASACQRLGVEPVDLSDTALEALEELGATRALALLEELPSDQREAVRGRVVEELHYSDLATRYGVSEVVARKRVSRGLAALRRWLQSEGETR
jgi:RNA polymerase sigma factor (sigma-70 family)